MTKSLYIVIRCGPLDKFDAIDEIKRIVDRRGYAWFGKYGGPLSKETEALINKGKEKGFVVLVRKASKEESPGYVHKVFGLREISRKQPSNSAEYPKYYGNVIFRIGSWLRLEPYRGPKFDLSALVVKSSLQSLPKSLSSSMRAHFFCRLWD